jgi:hypothetical protein
MYSALFLLLTALSSRNRGYLFKNSILAVLFHGMDGWDVADYLQLMTMTQETDHELKAAVEPLKASLRRNDEGLLKLKRD